MRILKCKMCGGVLIVTPGSVVCECEYCGSKQTIPNTDDEKRLKLYERANKLRYECEFDKASGVYESIVADYQSEAEAYWGLVLCKYGIEYVDDPKTGKKIPTCHRSSFDSVFDDANFDLVMENADTIARSVYREEAKQIEELRKGIIEVSSKEEDYDIFICYKETADDGQRTIDSVLAQDIYDELTDKGYRVFFSRITLEDKLGQEYEPYIFAALNSAKVMLAFGTSYDNYNAVWVKNEWSRFLQLMEAGQKKTLIPCFKDIDAYDMPKEFAKLQAQDLGKVGATQDLLRGIDKIFGRDKKLNDTDKSSRNVVSDGNAFIKRGYFALEDEEWDKAIDYFDQALNQEPENAEIHIGFFLAKRKNIDLNAFVENTLKELDRIVGNKHTACKPYTDKINQIAKENAVEGYLSKNSLMNQFDYDLTYVSIVSGLEKAKDIFDDKDWNKAERFAQNEFAEKLQKTKKRIISEIDNRIRNEKNKDEEKIERILSEYDKYVEKTEKSVIEQRFEAESKREKDYVLLCEEIDGTDSEGSFRKIIKRLDLFGDYKEAKEKIYVCEEKIAEIKKKELEKERERQIQLKKKIKRICICSSIVAILVIAGIIGYKIYRKEVIIPAQRYEVAAQLMQEQKYEEAISVYSELGEYKDCSTKINECKEFIQQKKEEEEVAAKEALVKEQQENYEEYQKAIENEDLESVLSLYAKLSDEKKTEAVTLIEDTIESMINDDASGMEKNKEWLESCGEIISKEKKQQFVDTFDEKCINKIIITGQIFNWREADYGFFDDKVSNSIDLFVDYLSEDGKYSETKNTLKQLLEIAKSYSEKCKNNIHSEKYDYRLRIYIEDDHSLSVSVSCAENETFFENIEGHIFSVGSDSIQIGEEDKITKDLYKAGNIEERTSPISGEWLTIPVAD